MELPIVDHHAVRLDVTVLPPLLRLLEAANERADELERRLAMLEPNDDKPDAPREPARETTAAALAELRARTELREEQDEPAETYSRVRGVVIALFHREPSWPPERWAPYQVLLDDGPHAHAGEKIYAPVDIDQCVRAPLGWPWPGGSEK